jgi:hypothetical protein
VTDIIYTVSAQQDDTPVRGNALASGDNKVDRECEDFILERLDRGDEWAWALVEVCAHITVDKERFEGRAYLGACSYDDEAAFKKDAYYEDLCKEARDLLLENLRAGVARGVEAQVALGHIEAAGTR